MVGLFRWIHRVGPGPRWGLWALFLTAWTTALLTPHPVRIAQAVLPGGGFFYGKTLHVLAYAGLTILTAWLGTRGARRWALLGLLSLHGFATEGLQTFVPLRGPSWADVGLDHIGISLGVLLSWRWWRYPPPLPNSGGLATPASPAHAHASASANITPGEPV
jgi:VanZ family protein